MAFNATIKTIIKLREEYTSQLWYMKFFTFIYCTAKIDEKSQ